MLLFLSFQWNVELKVNSTVKKLWKFNAIEGETWRYITFMRKARLTSCNLHTSSLSTEISSHQTIHYQVSTDQNSAIRMCHLKIDIYGCGHKCKFFPYSADYQIFTNQREPVLGRINCVVKNEKLCEPDAQAVNSKRHRESCEECIVAGIYHAKLLDVKSEWETQDTDGKIALEREMMLDARRVVSFPHERSYLDNTH